MRKGYIPRFLWILNTLTKTLKDDILDILITNCSFYFSVCGFKRCLFIFGNCSYEWRTSKHEILTHNYATFELCKAVYDTFHALLYNASEDLIWEICWLQAQQRSVNFIYYYSNLERMLCIATWCEKVLFVNIISSSWLN